MLNTTNTAGCSPVGKRRRAASGPHPVVQTPGGRRIHLSQRDIDILTTINNARILELSQLSRLHFGGSGAAYSRLRFLSEASLLRRIAHRRPLKDTGRCRHTTHVLFTLTQAGKNLIGAGEQDYRIPKGKGIEPHLSFMSLAINAMLNGIPWKYRHELEEEHAPFYHVPLRGMIGSTLLYHCAKQTHIGIIYEHFYAYCAVRGDYHSAVIVADSDEIRNEIIKQYYNGRISTIKISDLPIVFPKIIRDPSYFLSILLDRHGVTLSPNPRHPSHITDETGLLYAETISGDIATLNKLSEWPAEESIILALADHGLPKEFGDVCILYTPE